MNSDHDWDHLVRYVTGECDPAEARETLRWINADPERVRVVNELSRLHGAGGAIPRRWDVDAAWRKVAVPRAGGTSPIRRTPTFSAVRRSTHLAVRIAAGIILVMSAGALWHFMFVAPRPAPSTRSLAMHEIATQRGQLTTLHLSDGSRITLAAASRIRYARDFGAAGRPRDIYLEGRALFDVTHDERRPFRVHMGHVVAEDIGTRFVVTSYAEDSVDRVAVAEGIVVLREARDSVVLGHGDVGTAAPGAKLRVARDADLATDTAWASGRLVFRDAPLRDVVGELARWYDLDIRLVDPALGNHLLTAAFADVQRDAVLADLTRTLHLRSERVGSVVWLSRQ